MIIETTSTSDTLMLDYELNYELNKDTTLGNIDRICLTCIIIIIDLNLLKVSAAAQEFRVISSSALQ